MAIRDRPPLRGRSRDESSLPATELAREHHDAGISVGVVELMADESLDELISRGDAALYEAKARARQSPVPSMQTH